MGYWNTCTSGRPVNARGTSCTAVHTTQNKVQGLKRSWGRITYKDIWMGPWSLYHFQSTLRKNVQRSRKVILERQLHGKWNPQLTLPTASQGPCWGKGSMNPLMTSHTNPGAQSSLCWSREESPMLSQPQHVLLPSCQSLLWISSSPFFSCPYFPYFSHFCSDPSAASTVYLLSVSSSSSSHVFSLAPRSSCWAARSLVQWCNSADLLSLKQCLLSCKSPSKPSLWNGLVH